MSNLWRLVSGGLTQIEMSDTEGEALSVRPNKTDGVLFMPIGAVQPIGGTWTPTRIAANNVVLRKTAAADTTHLVASLRPYFRTAANKGVRVKSVDAIYSIGTLALTTHTAALSAVTYADNTAVGVAAHGGALSGALATAVQANPYATRLTAGTPAFAVSELQDIRAEIEIVAQATSAYDFYGLLMNYDFNNL